MTPREEVADVWHGERVVDPYRWLEDTDNERTRAWTDAQNARTRAVLDGLPQRRHFATRLRDLLAVGLLDTPRPVNGRIFHTRREGTQRQSILYVRDAVDGKDRALVDPNALDAAGLVTIDWYYPSPDASYVAYGLSRGGDEMSTLHIIEVATGHELPDRIPHTQRSTVAWADEGFYYGVNPAPGTVAPGDEHYHRRVRFHRCGDDPARDETVFGEGRPKEDIVWARTSPDGRWVLFHAFKGWTRSDLYLLDRRAPERGLRVVTEGEPGISEGFPRNDAIWIRTNLDTPNYQVVRADFDAPERSHWKTVVPETEHALEAFHVSRDHVAVVTLERATSRVALWSKDGRHERDVALPGHRDGRVRERRSRRRPRRVHLPVVHRASDRLCHRCAQRQRARARATSGPRRTRSGDDRGGADDLRVERRHGRVDVPRAPSRREAEWRGADGAEWLRRFQRLADAAVHRRRCGVGRGRRPLRASEPARRR